MTLLAEVSRLPLVVIGAYLGLLLVLGVVVSRFFRGTSADYFVASRSIGPFLLLMSLFGTTMTGFSLIGSTGKSFDQGIGVYGLMASWSGLVHSAVFFAVGIRLWAIGKRHGFVTQIQYFRARFQSNLLGYLLFPVLVGLVIPYLLIGLLGAGGVVQGLSGGMFPELFAATDGAVPRWITGLIIASVVLFYVFFAGVRSAAWANTFQTLVFMITGVAAFILIARALGGPAEASQMVGRESPGHLAREGMFGQWQFFTYLFIPLSVGMFPHIFQHWLTARSARTFRLAIVAHPVCILIVWAPCILVGMWGAGIVAAGEMEAPANPNALLGQLVDHLIASPILAGIVTAGVLAAIMSSLDSQFVCLGSMFTNDVVVHAAGRDRFTDRQKVWMGRLFVIAIVAITYLLSLLEPMHVFDLGVWVFSGFAGLFPLVFASLYWRRTTLPGAFACLGVTAVLWCGFFFGQDHIGYRTEVGDYLVLGLMPVAFIVLGSTAALVSVSLLTRPMARDAVEPFFQPERPLPTASRAVATAGA